VNAHISIHPIGYTNTQSSMPVRSEASEGGEHREPTERATVPEQRANEGLLRHRVSERLLLNFPLWFLA
jgi:hypothetical protein